MTNSLKRHPSVIMATCCIPWDAHYELDEPRFRKLVRETVTRLTPYVYVFGTAGEGYAVNERQFDQIARVFQEETTEAVPTVGLISLSLSTVQERIERCMDMGFTSFQISLPSWGACRDVEVDRFFAETCGRYPECRFLHYNLPRSKKMLTGEDYKRLAAAHPNLVAVKTGKPPETDFLAMVQAAPEIHFFVTEFNYAKLRDQSEVGFLISIASVDFAMAKRFFAARGQELAAMARDLKQMHDALVAAVGTAGPRIDGAYDKLFCRSLDPEFPLRLLPPYEGSTEETWQAFKAAIP